MKRVWFALVTAGLIVAGAGSMAVARERSAGPDESQAWKIWGVLRQATDLADELIQVDVEDGIVTLEGDVGSFRQREEAQQLAHVDGILGVNNRLKIRRRAD